MLTWLGRVVLRFRGREMAHQEALRCLNCDVQTVFTDETGEVLQASPGSTLLGNPLKVVLWLVGEMKSRGETLKVKTDKENEG